MDFLFEIWQSIEMYRTLLGFMANETKWVRKVISGLLGMFGIVAMIGGLSLVTDPSNDELGTMAAMVGLLFSVLAWKLWPSSNSKNIHNLSQQSPPKSIEIKIK